MFHLKMDKSSKCFIENFKNIKKSCLMNLILSLLLID